MPGTGGSGQGTGSIAAVLGGAALLLLASVTPWALFRLLPFVEAGAVAHLEGISQRARQAASVPTRGLAQTALRAAAGSALAGPAGLLVGATGGGGLGGGLGSTASGPEARGGSGRAPAGGRRRSVLPEATVPEASRPRPDPSGLGPLEAPGHGIPRWEPDPEISALAQQWELADAAAGAEDGAGLRPSDPITAVSGRIGGAATLVPTTAPSTRAGEIATRDGATDEHRVGSSCPARPVSGSSTASSTTSSAPGWSARPGRTEPESRLSRRHHCPDAACYCPPTMTDATTRSAVRYRFPPLERRGVIAGWRGGQIASMATSLVVGVLSLRASPSVGGVLIAVVTVACGVAASFWPIRGRTAEQWLPLVARWVWSGGDGRVQLAPAPGRGHAATVEAPCGPMTVAPAGGERPPGRWGNGRPGGGRPARDRRAAGCSTGCDWSPSSFHGEGSGPPAGVVLDGQARTATAALAVRGHSFALLSPTDQEARIAAWAAVLASLAREGSEVHRLQWIESCLPDGGGAVRRHWEDTATLGAESPAGRSYGALLDEAAAAIRRHRVLLCLSVHTSHSARAIRASGGGDRGCGAVLGREVLALRRALDGADIGVEGVLGPAALGRIVADAVSPLTDAAGGRAGSEGQRSAGDEPAVPQWPWPMAVRPEWDAVRTDGTWHATYWIAEWPRVDVTPDFLGPLLFAPLRRSIVLVMEPQSPSRAARQVAQARTADIADGELRRRSGFLISARQTREKHSVEERDSELADGHGQFRFSGYVTLTAESYDALQVAAVDLEQLSGQSHLELRRLYGEQDVAFTCSLPFGRGLS